MGRLMVDHYFEVSLTFLDGRVIVPTRFRTPQAAMAEAEGYEGVQGSISYVGEAGSDPVDVILYRPDGSIEVGDSVDQLTTE